MCLGYGWLERAKENEGVSAWEERILCSQAKPLEEFLALKMCRDERRYNPLSLWAHSHVRGSRRGTDEGDG